MQGKQYTTTEDEMNSTTQALKVDGQALAEIGAYRLSQMAGCMDPDAVDSIGAKFLVRVRNDVAERVEYALADLDMDFERAVEYVREGDDASEIADGAVPVYTYQMWQTFVDLGAWQEETDGLGSDADLNKRCAFALYQIGSRLVSAILDGLDAPEDED